MRRGRRKIGFAVDLDGVLWRGSDTIRGAVEAVRCLQEREIPFVLMTNGGGQVEKKKAEEIKRRLAPERELLLRDFSEDQIVLSHSPMRDWLVETYRTRKILLLGFGRVSDVARAYGFENFVRPRQIIEADPSVFGFSPYGLRTPEEEEETGYLCPHDPDEPVEAVVQMTDCVDWLAESQVVLDVLGGGEGGGRGTTQAVPYYNSNNDWVFSSTHRHPRLAQGSFVTAIEALWKRHTDGASELEIQHCGKPTRRTYAYAEKQLLSVSKDPDRPFDRIFGIGDNPPVDVRGANRAEGDRWRSVLVQTGVYDEGDALNREDRPFLEYANVGDAVRHILATEAVLPSFEDDDDQCRPLGVTATIFGRGDGSCPLCDEMKAYLEEYLRERKDASLPHVRIKTVDIAESAYWHDRYKYDIPVLHVNDQYTAKHRLETDAPVVKALEEIQRGRSLNRSGDPDARSYRDVKV